MVGGRVESGPRPRDGVATFPGRGPISRLESDAQHHPSRKGESEMTGRRSYGTGELYVRTDAHGRETWYGRWYSGSRRIKRVIGPKRGTGSRTGLTRPQAEREMRRRIESEQPSPTRSDVTVAECRRSTRQPPRGARAEAVDALDVPLASDRPPEAAPRRRSDRAGDHRPGRAVDRGDAGGRQEPEADPERADPALPGLRVRAAEGLVSSRTPSRALTGRSSRRAPTSSSSRSRRSRRCSVPSLRMIRSARPIGSST